MTKKSATELRDLIISARTAAGHANPKQGLYGCSRTALVFMYDKTKASAAK